MPALYSTARTWALKSLSRWELAVCGEIPAALASSPDGSARPSASAARIAARERSPIKAAAAAMSGSVRVSGRILRVP
jgi:hypothetical protein